MKEINVCGETRYDPSDMENEQLVATFMMFCGINSCRLSDTSYVAMLRTEILRRLG